MEDIMKKAILISMSFILAASVSFASTTQEKKADMPIALEPVTVVAKTKAKARMRHMAGKVETVTQSDPANGMKPEITIINKKSSEKTFIIGPATKIYSEDSKAGALNNIKDGERVSVKYHAVKNGVYEAVSISILT
jgi:hypothetical protein